MNDSADKLLQQLAGVGSPKEKSATPLPAPEQTHTGPISTDKQDRWRILLVDLVYLLNASFRDVTYWEGVKKEKDTFRNFIKVLHELGRMPKNDGRVHIRFRGSYGTKISQKFDYIIQYNGITVDITAVMAVIKRMGIRVKHLEGRLGKTFEMLSEQGVDSVFIKIPDSSDESHERMRISLRIISCYRKAVEDDIPIKYSVNGEQRSLRPILNEAGQPDPNLTQIAALNDLSANSLKEMIKKVAAARQRPDFKRSGIQYANVYQTIFNIRNLRQRLIRPPIELNSETASELEHYREGGFRVAETQGAKAGHKQESDLSAMPGAGPVVPQRTGNSNLQAAERFAAQGVGNADTQERVSAVNLKTGTGNGYRKHLNQIDPAALKSEVADFVKEAYDNSSETFRHVMNTVYGNDYRLLDPSGLETRLQLIANLLKALAKSEKGQDLLEGVLQRIQAGIDQLPKDVLGDLIVDDGVVKIWGDEKEKIIEMADNGLLNIIDASKNRSATPKNLKTALRADVQFSDQDYDDLAEAFNISIDDAEEIVRLLKSSFDSRGNFQKAVFDKNLSGFADHQKRIFEILWEFLKGIQHRSDRLPFLNSLQLLVREIEQPKQAIKILVSDFIQNPDQVSFLDRNAIMLAIQLLRTYNKEMRLDIEITPEEVLRVKEGLDQSVVRYMLWKIDGEQKRFVAKIVTIRQKILQSFEEESTDAEVLPVRFLLALEREVHIFLALVGGKTAAAVIRNALNAYGSPASKFYLLRESRKHTTSLLQHLAVLIRSLGRVGRERDIDLLDEVKCREQEFINLAVGPLHLAQVQRTLGWIDSAKTEIRERETKSGEEF